MVRITHNARTNTRSINLATQSITVKKNVKMHIFYINRRIIFVNKMNKRIFSDISSGLK